MGGRCSRRLLRRAAVLAPPRVEAGLGHSDHEPDEMSESGSVAAPVARQETGDLLRVNELHAGRCGSLVQLMSLRRSHEVDVGQLGCCTELLY